MTVKKTVLVVDDEPAVLDIVCKMLELEGYDVSSATDGATALQIAADIPLDAAVVDIRMPGMSGLDTIRKLKEIRPRLYVLVLTGRADLAEVEEALKLGAAGVVRKPFVFEVRTLLAMLAEEMEEAESAEEEAGVSVLVVDDDEQVREILRRFLTEQGYYTALARHGEEAIQMAKDRTFNIALIDVVMAPMDGLETYKAIGEISPQTKAIMMTGFGAPDLSSRERGERLNEALAAGAVGYLKKPFDLQRLGKAIEELTGRPAEEQ